MKIRCRTCKEVFNIDEKTDKGYNPAAPMGDTGDYSDEEYMCPKCLKDLDEYIDRQMKIQSSSDSGITYTGYGKDCGGFKPPAKGHHLDDQTEAFKGCKRKKSKKKKSFNLKEYKTAEAMRQKSMPEGGIIETINPKDLSPNKLERVKEWLEKKFPEQYWDLKKVYDFLKFHFKGEYPKERSSSDIEQIRSPYKGWLPQNVKVKGK